MKQRQKALARLRPQRLFPALCYLLAVLGWLVGAATAFGGDAAAKANGTLREQTLTVADFALADLTVTGQGAGADGVPYTELVTASNDPQMILEDVSGQTVRSLQMTAGYTGTVREMCLYYTTAPGQDYSQDRRVFPVRQADGSYLYTLPREHFVSLRLDPCSPEEGKTVTIDVKELRLNRPAAAASYFAPSWYQLFCLALYPGLVAAALSWAWCVWQNLYKYRRNEQK